ncbi:MAG TPA: protein kinase [Lapillicoccus sp.]|nr:protein kinase [Lapillicoccus sp.]
MNPEAGMTLGSRYTLTDRIATGGMGDVWRATDSVLGRDVAVKVMRASAAEDPTFADRFRDEARHSAGMSHQNIATVYDYGEDDGAAYLVMELVDGEPLSQMIARGPMNPDQVRNIAGQAALALAAAHQAGVVHRDVKPANILITPDGRVKLTDFGIARAVDGASHTRTGEVLGTPQYLSPEQALGKGATGASDLYALGIITQEMLTGRKPFDAGSAVATALAQVNDPPPPLPDGVPSDLRRIVEQSLAKDPADRPTSAAAVAAALGMPVTGLAQIPPATSVVHTGDTDPDGTQVMDSPTGTEVLAAGAAGAAGAAAYSALPPSGYDPGYEDGVPAYEPYPPRPQEPEKRRGIGLWWIPIIVLLAAIGFFAWAYASNSSSGTGTVTTTVTAPASTTSSSTSSAPTTITPTRTTATTTTQSTTSPPPQVVINKNDFVGKSFDEAKGILEGAGWKDDQIKRETKQSKEAAGTVIDVKPTGRMNVGTPITLTVSDGNATAAPKISEGGHADGD